MTKLTRFLLAEQTLNKKCPGIERIIDIITEYFNGIRPKIKDISILKKREWEKHIQDSMIDKNPDLVYGTYDRETGDICMPSRIKDIYVAVHEMVHSVFFHQDIYKFDNIEELIVAEVAKDIIERSSLKSCFYNNWSLLVEHNIDQMPIRILLRALNIDIRTLANEYVRYEDSKINKLREFIMKNWQTQGSPHNYDWDKAFDIIPDLKEEYYE